MKLPNKVDVKKFLDSDRAILILCVFIALVFWVLVKLSQTFYTVADVQINYQLPVGKSFVTSPPSNAIATLKGTGWDLISHYMKSEKSEVEFEIKNVTSQAINAGLLIDKIQQTVQSGIEINDVNMDFIFVEIESETESKVPVKLNHQIKLAKQFQLTDSIIIEPAEIILTGPSTEVENFKLWETKVLELENIKKDQSVEIELLPSDNKEIYLSHSKVTVHLKVEQFTEKSMFIPITIKNAPDSLKTFPEKAMLTCNVRLSKYNEVDRNSFELAVDLKGIPLNSEKNTIPVLISKKPAYIDRLDIKPKSVEFFFVETNKDSVAAPINIQE